MCTVGAKTNNAKRGDGETVVDIRWAAIPVMQGGCERDEKRGQDNNWRRGKVRM